MRYDWSLEQNFTWEDFECRYHGQLSVRWMKNLWSRMKVVAHRTRHPCNDLPLVCAEELECVPPVGLAKQCRCERDPHGKVKVLCYSCSYKFLVAWVEETNLPWGGYCRLCSRKWNNRSLTTAHTNSDEHDRQMNIQLELHPELRTHPVVLGWTRRIRGEYD